MKKILGVAVASATIATSAFAAKNMENPLFLPESGEIYSKTGLGLMFKVTDNSENQRLRGRDGAVEFPIWRPQEELGIGITNRWAVHAIAGYTYDGDANRHGFHLGRLGTTYRVIDSFDGYVWDLYGDFHLGGIERMKGSLVLSPVTGEPVFDYKNYSNGRWGAHVGTKFGRTWSRLTTSVFAEVLRTWGNHNNEINVSAIAPMFGGLLPDTLSVDIRSTWEFNAGANVFYQLSDDWSGGLSFRYNYHATNGLKGVHTHIPAAIQSGVDTLVQRYKDMHDNFSEYIIGLNLAYQLRDSIQIAWYAENTFDSGDRLCANTTDFKFESGFRLNLRF